MGAGLERLWKTLGTCRVKRLGALPTSLMVGKYAQGEPDSQRPSRQYSEPYAAAAADPRRLRALPPGSPGDVGLAEDAGVLRRHGPAVLRWAEAHVIEFSAAGPKRVDLGANAADGSRAALL